VDIIVVVEVAGPVFSGTEVVLLTGFIIGRESRTCLANMHASIHEIVCCLKKDIKK
jgi:hypothetical protein